MPLCANCEGEANYEYAPNPAFPTFYCSSHLPGFLKAQKAAGLLKRVENEVAAPVAAPSKKKKSPVVEEEAPVVEETTPVVEEPAPTE